GMELQLWFQGQLLGWQSAYDGVLATMHEKIAWTQRLELKEGKLWFSVVAGQSATWGAFGAGNSLQLSIDTTLPELNSYQPILAVENSGVVFASNRVDSLVLKTVRGYSADGSLALEDNQPVPVFRRND